MRAPGFINGWDESQGVKSDDLFPLIDLEITLFSIPPCSHLKTFVSIPDFLVTYLE